MKEAEGRLAETLKRCDEVAHARAAAQDALAATLHAQFSEGRRAAHGRLDARSASMKQVRQHSHARPFDRVSMDRVNLRLNPIPPQPPSPALSYSAAPSPPLPSPAFPPAPSTVGSFVALVLLDV